MTQMIGKQSIQFDSPVYIIGNASIVGKKEGEGPLGDLFDMIAHDAMFGSENWEAAESTLLKETAALVLGKSKIQKEDIRYLFAGDLLSQLIATSFGLIHYDIPLFGLYGACSTCGEALSLGAMCIGGGYAKHVLCMASSHFASAEKQFRFPLSYGNQRPLSSTYTVTGAGAFIVSDDKTDAKAVVSGITTGKIVDFAVKDSMNMGAAMAPAACDTIMNHLLDFNRSPDYYDKIITGDLGYIGMTLLKELLDDHGVHADDQLDDCGKIIFDQKTQGTNSGGSGCGCSAVVLSAYILKKLSEGEWKHVLFIPTGALLSPTSFNEGNSVPGIAHAVALSAPDSFN
ncbi:MAG: stage V sporulation protein AD [Clostridia bacterium]|nr:stage V sporulation protein AD [Clostridia bacterium]